MIELTDGSIRKPIGVAIDDAGTVFLTASRLVLPDNHVAGVVARLDRAAGVDVFAAGAEEPQGLAFDRDGNLYLTEGSSGRVMRFLAPRVPHLQPLPASTSAPAVTLAGTTDAEARVEARSGETTSHTLANDSGAFALPVPALIEAALFAAVQEQLAVNRQHARQQQRGARYLLQGLICCALCGYASYGKAISPAAAKYHQRTYAY